MLVIKHSTKHTAHGTRHTAHDTWLHGTKRIVCIVSDLLSSSSLLFFTTWEESYDRDLLDAIHHQF